MKHVARRHFYVCEVQEMGLIRVCWWHGKGNEADQGSAEGETHVVDEELLQPGPGASEGERGSSS